MLPTTRAMPKRWLAGTVALTGFVLTLTFYPEMSAGQVVRMSAEWLPAFGIGFTLRMDGFSWMFSLLVTGIGFLVVLYARYYMSPQDPVPRFFAFFLAFMGSMLGVVLAGNLIQLVFFWELTSLFSFLLIGYWHHNAGARNGARMALIVTSAGGLCLFAGALILGRIVGSYDLDTVSRGRRQDSYGFSIFASVGARRHRSADKKRAVSFPILASSGDGCANAGLRLPAFGRDGQAGCVPPCETVASYGGNRRLDLDNWQRRTYHAGIRRVYRNFPERPKSASCLFHH